MFVPPSAISMPRKLAGRSAAVSLVSDDRHEWAAAESPKKRRPSQKRARSRLPELPQTLWLPLLNAIPVGILLLSEELEPLYWNSSAIALCQRLHPEQAILPSLPDSVVEPTRHFLHEAPAPQQVLLVECPTLSGDIVRLTLRWLTNGVPETDSATTSAPPPEIVSEPRAVLIHIEDYSAMLDRESRFAQSKYGLTPRETEIFLLLRQEYSYREIADRLSISHNTVKTHVKNIYSKRRQRLAMNQCWYFLE